MNTAVRKKGKRSFTLIEILAVLFILGIACATIGIKGPTFVRHERFESGVEAIIDQIMLAQEFMLLYQTDLTLTLEIEKRGVLSTISASSKDIARSFKKKIDQPMLIKGIESLFFNDEERKRITLTFHAEDYIVTKGLLGFGTKGKKKEIFLPGFPTSLNKLKKDEKPLPKVLYPQDASC